MPQSPSYRRDLESQRRLLEQELFRLYASDDSELNGVRETLARLETRRGDLGTRSQDHADLNTARDILDRTKAIATDRKRNRSSGTLALKWPHVSP